MGLEDYDFYDLEEVPGVLAGKAIAHNEDDGLNCLNTETVIKLKNEHRKNGEKDLMNKTNLSHLKVEIEDINRKSYICSQCDMTFDNESDIAEHQYFHHEYNFKSESDKKDAFECSQCFLSFGKESDLVGHMKSNHQASQVSQKPGVKKRLNTCTSEPFLCTCCGKEFGSNQSLCAHNFNVHSHVEAKCEVCEKTFKNKHYVSAHKRSVHDLATNYQKWKICDICCKTFKTGSLLSGHKKHVHDAEEGLMCSICTVSVRNKYALRKHEKKCGSKDRSKIKLPKQNLKFPCKKCKSQFSSSDHLKIHNKYAHDITPTQCQLCYRRFKNVIHVRQHLRRIHSQGLSQDFYRTLQSEVSKEFLPKEEVDVFEGDPMLLLYKMQAQRIFTEIKKGAEFHCNDQ